MSKRNGFLTGFCNIKSSIIEDVHVRINQHRRARGLPEVSFQIRTDPKNFLGMTQCVCSWSFPAFIWRVVIGAGSLHCIECHGRCGPDKMVALRRLERGYRASPRKKAMAAGA